MPSQSAQLEEAIRKGVELGAIGMIPILQNFLEDVKRRFEYEIGTTTGSIDYPPEIIRLEIAITWLERRMLARILNTRNEE